MAIGPPRSECREYWGAAKRNLDREARRSAREHAKAKAGNGMQIRKAKADITQEPFDVELISPVSEEVSEEHALSPD